MPSLAFRRSARGTQNKTAKKAVFASGKLSPRPRAKRGRESMHGSMNWIDTCVLGAYLTGITLFGIWVGFCRNASSKQYFLANQSPGWFTVGAAVFTSNIPTIHPVGLAASGAKDGRVIGNFEWMACFTLILLGLVCAPF